VQQHAVFDRQVLFDQQVYKHAATDSTTSIIQYTNTHQLDNGPA
jgi:hypothetical protein